MGSSIRYISVRDHLRAVPQAWDAQYPNPNPENKLISDRLHALDLNTVSAKTIDDIIGNDSWTTATCFVCDRRRVMAVARIENTYEESFDLCRVCATKVANLFP